MSTLNPAKSQRLHNILRGQKRDTKKAALDALAAELTNLRTRLQDPALIKKATRAADDGKDRLRVMENFDVDRDIFAKKYVAKKLQKVCQEEGYVCTFNNDRPYFGHPYRESRCWFNNDARLDVYIVWGELQYISAPLSS